MDASSFFFSTLDYKVNFIIINKRLVNNFLQQKITVLLENIPLYFLWSFISLCFESFVEELLKLFF